MPYSIKFGLYQFPDKVRKRDGKSPIYLRVFLYPNRKFHISLGVSEYMDCFDSDKQKFIGTANARQLNSMWMEQKAYVKKVLKILNDSNKRIDYINFRTAYDQNKNGNLPRLDRLKILESFRVQLYLNMNDRNSINGFHLYTRLCYKGKEQLISLNAIAHRHQLDHKHNQVLKCVKNSRSINARYNLIQSLAQDYFLMALKSDRTICLKSIKAQVINQISITKYNDEIRSLELDLAKLKMKKRICRIIRKHH